MYFCLHYATRFMDSFRALYFILVQTTDESKKGPGDKESSPGDCLTSIYCSEGENESRRRWI